MLILEPYFLFFSKTRDRDYRWIYIDPKTNSSNVSLIQDDYQSFLREQGFNIYSSHLYVRRINNEVFAVYKFFNTNRKDKFSRCIKAISGMFFSNSNYYAFSNNLSVYASYCFYNMLCYEGKLKDTDEYIESSFSYMFDYNKKYIEEKNISNESKLKETLENFLISEKCINGFAIYEKNGEIIIKSLDKSDNELSDSTPENIIPKEPSKKIINKNLSLLERIKKL